MKKMPKIAMVECHKYKQRLFQIEAVARLDLTRGQALLRKVVPWETCVWKPSGV